VDFRESLAYLYGLQTFGIKLGLDNIRALLTRLGHPEQNYGIIHVGGTNGKGSVCACLAQVLREAGFRVGLYTSPHLHSFTERIQVDGEAISEAEVARYTDELRLLAEGIPATFFEFTTAMALLHFQRRKVDLVVLEVGMGGRLDATNAVERPRVTVITSVCRDHTRHLGTELPEIAAEKGGIIKPGIPLVLGRQLPGALDALLELAKCRKAPVRLCGRDFAPHSEAAGFSYRGRELQLDHLSPGLIGGHQHENLSLALAAIEELRRQGLSISPSAMRSGVAGVRWPGRLEWWAGQRRILLDGAHNEGGAAVLAAYLGTLGQKRVRWVVGIKGDKDPQAILAPLLPQVALLYCTVPPVEEAVSPAFLAAVAEAGGRPARTFVSCQEAMAAALADCGDDDVVLVAGSLFLVAAAREYLLNDLPFISAQG
jgi:dihydrofolate synthase/folylpolyglutamate synthase